MTNDDKTKQLLEKLDLLIRRQEDFGREINDLRFEIDAVKTTAHHQPNDKEGIIPNSTLAVTDIAMEKVEIVDNDEYQALATQEIAELSDSATTSTAKGKSNLEKFIGENLINKIGIAITVVGVGIGAKYSIDNELISPLSRIILAYLTGLALLAVGIKLKPKYESFSAVLVSGSMAIMYFITYLAYSFYDLLPSFFAFTLMVIFTAFTVLAAINYNRQVIAHIGLVGAYAVPFLLSDGSGKVAILFSYIAIINIGILALAFKKYWKPLYYASFGLSWLVYMIWYVSKYQTVDHFVLALAFLSVFFFTFYLTFLAYKLRLNGKIENDDIVLLLANSFVFYGIGYSILSNHSVGEQLLGPFTLGNAVVHFIVSMVIYRQKLANKNLFYLASGLVLVFITIAIPVQLDGNWVTLLWAGESVLLFWIGRTKNVPFYEKLSYLLMLSAFFSIIHDWMSTYNTFYPENPDSRITPLLNRNFLSSILFIATFGFITVLHRERKYASAMVKENSSIDFLSLFIGSILLISLYYAFRMEISNYWNQLYADSALIINSEGAEYPNYFWNHDLIYFKKIWILNYSLLFIAILTFVNFRKLKSPQLGVINFGLILLGLTVFLAEGLYMLSVLRESYLEQNLLPYYQIGKFNLGIRYVSFAFVAIVLFSCHKYIHQDLIKKDLKIAVNLLLHISILWIASSELIHWMDLAESTQAYKLGLSILWGIYSLFLIALGIWKRNKYLRIGAIGLFGVTLAKLFVYDISNLDTIAKTIVFVALGILLLIISFLYNKYRHIISDEAES